MKNIQFIRLLVGLSALIGFGKAFSAAPPIGIEPEEVQPILLLKHRIGDPINTAEFNNTNDRVITAATDSVAKIWDIPNKKLLHSLPHKVYHQVNSANFNPTGDRAVTASIDNTAKIWNPETGELLFTLNHDREVNKAVFNSTGSRIATASDDGTAKVWDPETGELVNSILHEIRPRTRGSVTNVFFNPTGNRLVTYAPYGLFIGPGFINPETIQLPKNTKIWSPETGELLQTLEGVKGLAYSPDGEQLITISENTAQVWNPETGEQLFTLNHDDVVHKATFDSRGDRIATASMDGTAKIWNARAGVLLQVLGSNQYVHHDIYDIGFNNSGQRIVTANRDDAAQVWDVETGKLLKILPHTDPVFGAAYSPNGQFIITRTDFHTALIWPTDTMIQIKPARPSKE